MGRRDHPHIDFQRVRVPPTRSAPPATRSSLAWKAGDISPISSRKMLPPSADSKRPRRDDTAPVKAPFSPEEFRFEQVFRAATRIRRTYVPFERGEW